MKKLMLGFISIPLVLVACCLWGQTNTGVAGHESHYTYKLQTTDISTNTIFEFTPPFSNCVVRVEARFLGYNSTSCASYGRIITARVVGGNLSQVTSTASIGIHEDDGQYEGRLTVGPTTIIGQVAGNNGRTVNWTAIVDVYCTP